ncbi:calmodulin-like [Gigantopelta aegis]|uniref:calmodulin-like n=1 Tax=Gigantopelta aegis TaxID=1735272 RepID=UPI001B888EAB|nr:calmodulin-like [Gigantopelta aegis]
MTHLTKEERRKYTEQFLNVDKDGNGWLDMSELGKMLLSEGFDIPFSKLENLFKQMDTDGNGRITLDEFLAQMPHVTTETERRQANLTSAFKEVDEDGDGYITPNEMKKAFKLTGMNLSLQVMQLTSSTSQSEKIEMAEFLKIFKNLFSYK